MKTLSPPMQSPIPTANKQTNEPNNHLKFLSLTIQSRNTPAFLKAMASIISFLILTLLPSLTLSLPSSVIYKTCKTTTYYDLCVSSLNSDPQGPTAVDVNGLSTVAINLAISNATNTSSYATGLAARSATDPALRALLAACATKYTNAREALQSSLDALSAESYDYAFVHVSAAGEYPAVCRVLFRQRPEVAYPAELARREVALQRLCTVALDIISMLG